MSTSLPKKPLVSFSQLCLFHLFTLLNHPHRLVIFHYPSILTLTCEDPHVMEMDVLPIVTVIHSFSFLIPPFLRHGLTDHSTTLLLIPSLLFAMVPSDYIYI